MSEQTSTGGTAAGLVRTVIGVVGIVAVVVGLMILIWPAKTAMIVAALIATYAVVSGIVHIGMAAFGKTLNGRGRAAYGVLGLIQVVVGIVIFTNLGAAAGLLATIIAIAVGIMWIIEGVVALAGVKDLESKGIAILFAVISIIAGITVLASPLWAAAFLWWLLGISLMVLGVIQIVRAFRLGKQV